MKVTIKNVKFSESLSEETNAFTADIFVDNKKIGYAKNSGQGGNTDCHFNPDTKEKYREVETYLESLPDITYKSSFGSGTIKSNMENVVDELFEAWLTAKDDKKLLANMDKGILVGTKESYTIHGWKNISLKAFLSTPTGRARVKQLVLELKSKGKTILNTNLPNEIL
jgi:hypothetical protein